jgi:Peptidase U49
VRVASTEAKAAFSMFRKTVLGATELSHRELADILQGAPRPEMWRLFEDSLYDLVLLLDEHLTADERAATETLLIDIYPSTSINGVTYNLPVHGPIIGISSAVHWMMLLDSLVFACYENLRRDFRKSVQLAKDALTIARAVQTRNAPPAWPAYPELSQDLWSRLPGLFQNQFAFIAAHEIGHAVLRHHLAPRSHEFSWREELDADAFAADLLLRIQPERPGVQSTLDAVFVKLRLLDAALVGFERISASRTTHPPPGIRRISLAHRKQLPPIGYSALVEVLTMHDLFDELD